MAFFRFLTRGGGAVGFFRPQEPKSSNNVSTSSLSAQGSPAFSSARSASRRPRTGMSVMVSGRRSPAANTATQPSNSRRMNSASELSSGQTRTLSGSSPRRGPLWSQSRRRRRLRRPGPWRRWPQVLSSASLYDLLLRQLFHPRAEKILPPPEKGRKIRRENFKVCLFLFAGV